MLILAAASLTLIGLSAASPLGERQQVVPNYPSKSASKGFRLVVNVTDPSTDFQPPIQNTYVSSIHVGAGLALVGQGPDAARGRIFYQNGTVTQQRYSQSNVLSDSGTPPFPSGLKLVKDPDSETLSTAHLDGGPGQAGIGITRFPEPYAFLYPETWVACNESLRYYQGQYFVIFKQANTTIGDDASINPNVPDGCIAVRLVPECTQLNDLPAGAIASHEHALDSECYPDVKSLDWAQYGP
ncbi:uncharacterized protein MAM_00430 [Metarhizium album ARSEF 1941]|uniref:DUF7907 domain-containing protein n=1 Tax=Metarhizium album (strain ARSEF 1941) TaxID=1081103 RepID=A0A0B2X4Y1_METAS|nr:uncharacterized protein MAM_00430 [Metarhizium album ARSEF 1941]KHO01429.1 hypothetical protein MAM_00430 [Metarhizium album ARSEF 1941]